jgi:23S rRNA (adenine2503-C2)-methyltransferase
MPLNKRFGLQALRSALEYYYERTKQRVTYEYIFFEGINDTDKEVAALIAFARRVPCKINVIPFHSIGFTHPQGFAATLRPSHRMKEIVDVLRGKNITVMVRGSAGEDIEAACGQLAVEMEHTRRRRAGSSKRIQHPTAA